MKTIRIHVIQVTPTCRVVQILKSRGEEFERSLRNDEYLQEATRKALEEETDSNDSWFTRVTMHLKEIITHFFSLDEEGSREFMIVHVI